MASDIIITESGAHNDTWQDEKVLHLNGDDDPVESVAQSKKHNKILIRFETSHDGRGFSLARQLRDSGYKGHLRARGAIVPDQWRHLRKTGFDDLALTVEQIKKMPIESWQEVQDLSLPDYQDRIFNQDKSE